MDALSEDVTCQLRQLWQLEAYLYERLQQLSAQQGDRLRPQATLAFSRCLQLGALMLRLFVDLTLPPERRFTLQPWPEEARHLGGIAELLAERYAQLACLPSASAAVVQLAERNGQGVGQLPLQLQQLTPAVRRCA